MTKKEAEAKIKKAIEQNGNYTNNMIGSVLRQFANEHGFDAANKLIDKFDITTLYGIEKVVKHDG